MPNRIVEDSFNYSFSRKEFWSGVLGTSQEGSHPWVGARCYLLNTIFNKFIQNNLFFWSMMKVLGHIMKDIGMTNKVGISDVLFFTKFEIFSFQWLRQVFQQLISHQKSLVSAA